MNNESSTIQFKLSSLEEHPQLLAAYRKQIAIPYDDFFEGYILASSIYSIWRGPEVIGFFGLHEKLLTIFFVDDLHFEIATQIFAEIRRTFEPTEAFVPTTDLGALSVVLENYQKLEIQALHFSATARAVRPARFAREHFRLATRDNIAEIEQVMGDFLDDYEEKVASDELYVLEDNHEIIGVGILVRNQIMENCIGTGMFTKESRRGEGVGRSVILHLKSIVQAKGLTPVPGCWYYNTGSRKTLESAGYITKSKLLKITL